MKVMSNVNGIILSMTLIILITIVTIMTVIIITIFFLKILTFKFYSRKQEQWKIRDSDLCEFYGMDA